MNSVQYQAASAQPAPEITVESVTQEIYDDLLNLGSEIDMVEGRLSTLTHVEHVVEKAGTLAPIERPMPEAIQKLQGLRDSVRAHRSRLESIRLRLAV
nr:hypothetical protein HUO10_003305 [Paraburkholderia busanensis]